IRLQIVLNEVIFYSMGGFGDRYGLSEDVRERSGLTGELVLHRGPVGPGKIQQFGQFEMVLGEQYRAVLQDDLAEPTLGRADDFPAEPCDFMPCRAGKAGNRQRALFLRARGDGKRNIGVADLADGAYQRMDDPIMDGIESVGRLGASNNGVCQFVLMQDRAAARWPADDIDPVPFACLYIDGLYLLLKSDRNSGRIPGVKP